VVLDQVESPVVDQAAQALIEEARRRQRRRWRWVAALVIFIILLAIGVIWGGSRPPGAPVAKAPASPTPQLMAHWTNLSASGAGLPPGAQVSSVVSWQGELVATGSYWPGSALVATGYPRYAPVVVWTSKDGSQWSMTWDATGGGSDIGSFLVATPSSILLFASGEGGSSEWRSVDATTFVPVSLPTTMMQLNVRQASWAHGLVVVLVSNKYTGSRFSVYGEQGDSIWTSPNGVTWTRDPFSGVQVLSSLTATATGFMVTGESPIAKRSPLTKSRMWVSSDGRNWTSLPSLAPTGSYSAGANVIVAENPYIGLARFWWSSDGRVWTRAKVQGQLFRDLVGPSGTLLATVPGGLGFVTSGNPETALWSSTTGAVWTELANPPGFDPTRFDVGAYFPDPQGLLAEVFAPDPIDATKAMSFWQVTFSRV